MRDEKAQVGIFSVCQCHNNSCGTRRESDFYSEL